MTFNKEDFEILHRDNDDPWAFRTSWYEERKRALTLAALPRGRYETGFEPGCSIGQLSSQLAMRCDRLLAWDVSESALRSAAAFLSTSNNVSLELRYVPEDWPDEPLDLIVLSEIGYFLKASSLPVLVERIESTLTSRGTLLLCHWIHAIKHGELDGVEVHRYFIDNSRLGVISRVNDADFQIVVMTRDGLSVGDAEGIT